MNPDPGFWHGRRVFLTGHTGFKGAWAVLWLNRLGAEVHGFALPPKTDPSLWAEAGGGLLARETLADLADRGALATAVAAARPEVVIHMAAQPIVRTSFADPVGTIATNTMGTVHLLDALRQAGEVKAVIVVTTDKVYANPEDGRAFAEDDPLGGHDPYSASKAAAEILTRSLAASFLAPAGVAVATARAGNVIGGGDWSKDRLVPDVWRAAQSGEPLRLRYPLSTRPWQHVVEPVGGYLRYAERLAAGADLPHALNFAPATGQGASVAQVAESVGRALGLGHPWQQDPATGPAEMTQLSLDPRLARDTIGWESHLGLEDTIGWTAEWYVGHRAGTPAAALCHAQIERYEAMA